MNLETTEHLQRLGQEPERIRNFCVVAHVDHGKTTLSDYLVASNGILSPQLAGEVRLLDSRPDEQERRITMKASSVVLRHLHEGVEHLLNLVDSPGHIDFSCEVSTAMRLCDGAVVIVDVVDGVTQQSNGILRHAYREGLSMCLVLNKVDLLITVQQLSPEEAYYRMRSIVETCNAALAGFANQLKIQEEDCVAGKERDDPSDDVWFCPTKGNVLFASCHDGWAFSTEFFSRLYEGKLGVPDLQKHLWGEYYLKPQMKGVDTTPRRAGQQTLAVQLMLEPIWKLYSVFLDEKDDGPEKQLSMAAKLGIPEKLWNNPRRGQRGKLKALLSSWMPLAKCVLSTVCSKLDSPVSAQRRRLRFLIPRFDEAPTAVREALMNCSPAPDVPCVVYVCKLVDTQFLVGTTLGREGNDDDAFIGFARVYSGRLRPGMKMYVHSDDKVVEATVGKVFLFRGAGLDEADEVCSGTLCGVGGLTPYIAKYATLSSLEGVPPLNPLVLPSTSIVRASVFPRDPKDLFLLQQGLRLLYKVDPQVEVSILPTGEHVIGTAGEVHMERCLRDLIDTFARVEVMVSESIVSFRETIVATGPSAKPKLHTATTPDGAFAVTLYARCMPQEVLDIIKDDNKNRGTAGHVIQRIGGALNANKRWSKEIEHGVVACGPQKLKFVGVTLLLNFSEHTDSLGVLQRFNHWKDSIVAGFQAAAESGPMAQEPMFNIAFVITDINVEASTSLTGGMVLPCVRDACRAAMELHSRRLVEPVYECTVYSSGATQGKIYGSLSRRRSDIIEEVPNEGSDLFYIRCLLPAVEAFGLQDELRVVTQGASTAQLQMSHWNVLDADPYFTPTTREEIEEHGAEVATKNIAEQLLERVRRRKGLHRERVVENAEKQKFSLKGA
ncbi:translation elongation factor EF-2, putative [Trypanosoma brucei gambiense DAL972]|uniref:Elongation factor 2 n=1 Tax=Trypanosoma brucei gambiense (strain MHOM/CI/86/DAL972) TaxID=679716 RepID=C9ZKB0_TRYB9|nr:translation elongation factor EF-2, putative [Trypanosoma brucei gambiense DAL972]CBH09874.1 translation elongation factor EF-2, putative [Trypanosoma brucei gambiense DAL972]|eukprot:XP_011772167.1 translation elongation factor EF-2, putative [Trypanosoma brucei gambiense DAL972]